MPNAPFRPAFDRLEGRAAPAVPVALVASTALAPPPSAVVGPSVTPPDASLAEYLLLVEQYGLDPSTVVLPDLP